MAVACEVVWTLAPRVLGSPKVMAPKTIFRFSLEGVVIFVGWIVLFCGGVVGVVKHSYSF